MAIGLYADEHLGTCFIAAYLDHDTIITGQGVGITDMIPTSLQCLNGFLLCISQLHLKTFRG